MRANRLQANPSKNEVLWCSSGRRQHQIPTTSACIGTVDVLMCCRSPRSATSVFTLTRTFRCLDGTAPSYLADSIYRVADVEGRRHLRSSATATLIVPPVRRSTLGDRSFSVAAPRAWNSMQSDVGLRAASSLTTFRRELKTCLYCSSFLDH